MRYAQIKPGTMYAKGRGGWLKDRVLVLAVGESRDIVEITRDDYLRGVSPEGVRYDDSWSNPQQLNTTEYGTLYYAERRAGYGLYSGIRSSADKGAFVVPILEDGTRGKLEHVRSAALSSTWDDYQAAETAKEEARAKARREKAERNAETARLRAETIALLDQIGYPLAPYDRDGSGDMLAGCDVYTLHAILEAALGGE